MAGPEAMRKVWDQYAEGYDTAITPFGIRIAEDALERVGIRPGVRFLDVAAGGGALSIPAARRGANVLATDFSPVMIDRLNARARAEGLSNLEVAVMDGHALQLEDGSFDISGSQLGIMLFPDRGRALAELARVTRPGGKAMMIVFGPLKQVEGFDYIFRALHKTATYFVPPTESPLFSLQDPEQLREEMTEAGLGDVRVDTVDHKLEVASANHLWNVLITSTPPIGAVIEKMSEEERRNARQELERLMKDRSDAGPAMLNMQVHIAIGTK